MMKLSKRKEEEKEMEFVNDTLKCTRNHVYKRGKTYHPQATEERTDSDKMKTAVKSKANFPPYLWPRSTDG